MKILDDFLAANEPEYQRMETKLNAMGEDYLRFCRELYYGGDKAQGNQPLGSRQMILSDIFQYMLTGRMIYQASKSLDVRKRFVKVLMYLVNQWLVMDCFGPKEALVKRRQLIDKLKTDIGADFYEGQDSYHLNKINETFQYENDLIPKKPNPNPPSSTILSGYDSLFPKIRGGPIEVLIYLYLIQRNLGLVTSLLTQQVLLGGSRAVAPPDLFLLRRKGEIMGLEIGRGKEKQSADFGLLTGIPTFSVDLVDRQPFRCDGCGRWIIYCDRIIEKYSEEGIPKNHNHVVHCVDCPHFNDAKCPDIICLTERMNRYGVSRKARYHLRCLPPTEQNQVVGDETMKKEQLVAYFPLVEGLQEFPEE